MNSIKTSQRRPRSSESNGEARLGFEEHLWGVADALRGKIEPAEYKHVVLSVLFLHSLIKLPSGNIRVPAGVSWDTIADRGSGCRGAVMSLIDGIEQHNPDFIGVIPRPPESVPDETLAMLIQRISGIPLPADRITARDLLGRVYEYFIGKFASSEGRSGGEYYTPKSVVRMMVESIRPDHGSVYDPCCGTAGMFIQSEEFLHQGKENAELKVYGQESSLTTWRLAKMNLALHGLPHDIGLSNGDTFLNDLHPRLKADFILANPPFNQKAWGSTRLAGDTRWRFGEPSDANANYAWIQHMYAHLADDGVAAFVLSNGSLASGRSEFAIRKGLLEADVVECIITLPSQLFYGTQIPACVWIISPAKTRGGKKDLRGKTLFIDARHLGHLVDRVHAELSESDVQKVAETYRRWRDEGDRFQAEPGFSYAANLSEIELHKFALVPGRYVGFSPSEAAFDREHVLRELPEAVTRLRSIAQVASSAASALEALNG